MSTVHYSGRGGGVVGSAQGVSDQGDVCLGGVCFRRGVSVWGEGVCPGGCLPRGWLPGGCTSAPPSRGQTNTCENIVVADSRNPRKLSMIVNEPWNIIPDCLKILTLQQDWHLNPRSPDQHLEWLIHKVACQCYTCFLRGSLSLWRIRMNFTLMQNTCFFSNIV